MDFATLSLRLDARGLVQGTDKARAGLKGVSQQGQVTAKVLRGVTTAMAGLGLGFSAFKAATFAKDTIQLGARYETLGVVMETLGKNIGKTANYMHILEDQMRTTGISMVQARNTISRMIGANIDLAHATDLARIAQNAAVIADLNSSDAFERLIYGITTGQVRVLRSMGIFVDFNKALDDFAKTHDKTIQQLKEDEKTQIRANEVKKAGRRIMGAYENALKTASKQMRSAERYLEDMRVAVSQAFLPEYTKFVFTYANALKWVQENANGVAAALKAVGLAAALGLSLVAGALLESGVAWAATAGLLGTITGGVVLLTAAVGLLAYKLHAQRMEEEAILELVKRTAQARTAATARDYRRTLVAKEMGFGSITPDFIEFEATIRDGTAAVEQVDAFTEANKRATAQIKEKNHFQEIYNKTLFDEEQEQDPADKARTQKELLRVRELADLQEDLNRHYGEGELALEKIGLAAQLALDIEKDKIGTTSAQRKELEAERRRYHAAQVADIEHRIAKANDELRQDLLIRRTRAIGLTREADAMEFYLEQQREVTEARKNDADATTLEALAQTHLGEATERTSRLQREDERTAQDLQMRILRAQGFVKEADAAEFAAQQLREYEDAKTDGATANQLWALQVAQGLEALKREEELTRTATESLEDMAVARLRSQGDTDTADQMELGLRQQREMDEAVRRNADAAELFALGLLHMAQAIEHAGGGSGAWTEAWKTAFKDIQRDVSTFFKDVFDEGLGAFEKLIQRIRELFTDLFSNVLGKQVAEWLAKNIKIVDDKLVMTKAGKQAVGVGGAATMIGGIATGDPLTAALGGAALGSVLPGIGTVVGGAVGFLGGLASAIFGSGEAAAEAAKKFRDLTESFRRNIRDFAAGLVDNQHLKEQTQIRDTAADLRKQALEVRNESLRNTLASDFLELARIEAEYATTLLTITVFEAARLAKLEAEYQQAQRHAQQDYANRKLVAEGRLEEAGALAFAQAQQREYSQAVKEGANATTLAALGAAQAAEALAYAAEIARVKAEKLEDLEVRMLRARYDTKAADAMAFRLQQEREYAEAVRAGADEVYLARLAEVQGMEALQWAREQEVRAAEEQIAVLNDQISALEEASKRHRALADSLREASREAGATLHTPIQQVQSARAAFEEAARLAQGGDEDAAARLPELARALLEASRQYNASGLGYVRDVQYVQGVLDALADRFAVQATLEELSLEVLVEQRDALLTLIEELRKLPVTVEDYTGGEVERREEERRRREEVIEQKESDDERRKDETVEVLVAGFTEVRQELVRVRDEVAENTDRTTRALEGFSV